MRLNTESIRAFTCRNWGFRAGGKKLIPLHCAAYWAQLRGWHETFFLILMQTTCGVGTERGLIQFTEPESSTNKALVRAVRRLKDGRHLPHAKLTLMEGWHELGETNPRTNEDKRV